VFRSRHYERQLAPPVNPSGQHDFVPGLRTV
jgi:hypothetical protein